MVRPEQLAGRDTGAPGGRHRLRRRLRGAGRGPARVFALALDLDQDFFVRRCTGNTWSVNLNWYPARAAVGEVLPGQMRIGQHTDFGTLTLLDRQPGSGDCRCAPWTASGSTRPSCRAR